MENPALVTGLSCEWTPEPTEVFECGVDWLTCTCEEGDTQEAFDDAGHRLLFWERSNGEKFKPWRFRQFEGFRCGGVGFGKWDHLSIMRLSSKTAWSNWKRIHALSTNCSRIDLQVTVANVFEPVALLTQYHLQAMSHVRHRKKPPQIDLRLSNRSSPTLYFNQRTSERFARIYDKHDESKLDHYKATLRYEVQFHDDAARHTSHALARSENAAIDASRLVAGFFATRGISSKWNREGLLTTCSPRSRGDLDSSLRWIRRQVRPAVKSLLESGRTLEVVEALGLSELIDLSKYGPYGPKPQEET